jgi:hypothetical protein
MAFDKLSACSALKKGWKSRGLDGAAIEGAYQKCLRNYTPPARVKRRAKKSK